MTNVRVKVKVADLIGIIEAEKAKVLEAYNKAVEEYPAVFEKWQLDAHAAVNKAKPNAKSKRYGASMVVGYRPFPPAKPTTARYDSDIRLLKMAVEDELTITHTSDFYRYLKVGS